MQSIEKLDLPVLPMESHAFASNPYPYLAAARAQHPWLAKCAYGYVVHQFEAIHDLLWQDDALPTAYKPLVAVFDAQDTPWGRFQENHMLAYTGTDHRRLREILGPKFTPRKANRARPMMQAAISRLLDEWGPRGRFDFEEFASFFPITVLCTLIGAPTDEIPNIRDTLEILGLTASMDPAHLPALQEAQVVLDDFVRTLVADRRAGKRAVEARDTLDDLLEVNDGGGLTDGELYDLLVFLFIAGYDSSKNVMTMIMNQMLDHLEIYARCAESVVYCRKVVEEGLRYATVGTVPRIAAEDVAYRDVLLPKGTILFFPLSTSGRDPAAFEDADRFDPERDNHNRPMGFGRGRHICLGQFIARAQMEEGLHQIARRIRNPRRAGPSDWRPFYGTWGMRGLPIEFEPEGKGAEPRELA